MDLSHIEFEVSKKIKGLIEDLYKKDVLIDGSWVEIERLVEDKVSPLYKEQLDESVGLSEDLEYELENLRDDLDDLDREISIACKNLSGVFGKLQYEIENLNESNKKQTIQEILEQIKFGKDLIQELNHDF